MQHPVISAELAHAHAADRRSEAAVARTARDARPPRRRSLRRGLAAVATLVAAGLGLATLPGAANAQSLQSVSIRTHTSGYLVLDVAGGSTSAGAGLIQWIGHGGANQRFNFVELPDGNELVVNQKSGMCVTTDGVAGHQLYQAPCNDRAHQEWRGTLHNVFGAGFINGDTLKNPSTGLVMDIEGGNSNPGARAIGWYPNDGFNQEFSYWQLF
jgi:ricin-type beta-trefoil lectin protein